MISRKSTLLIAQIYFDTFTALMSVGQLGGSRWQLRTGELHDFFYERDYDQWFLNWIQQYREYSQQNFRDFIKGLQTGYSLSGALGNSVPNERRDIGIKVL